MMLQQGKQTKILKYVHKWIHLFCIICLTLNAIIANTFPYEVTTLTWPFCVVTIIVKNIIVDIVYCTRHIHSEQTLGLHCNKVIIEKVLTFYLHKAHMYICTTIVQNIGGVKHWYCKLWIASW